MRIEDLSAITSVSWKEIISEFTRIMRVLCIIGAIFCVFNAAFAQVTGDGESTLKLVPELVDYWLLEGSPLKLDCVYKYTDQPELLAFYKDDVSINMDGSQGYNFTNTKAFVAGKISSTTTLYKSATTMSDSGTYRCAITSSNSYSELRVHIFKVISKNAELVDGAQSVSLTCAIDGVDSASFPDISWRHNDTELHSGNKYQMHEGNWTLDILTPGRDDIGEYFCDLTFNAMDGPLAHKVSPQAVLLTAPPKIVSSDKNKNYVHGDQLDLKCMVSGYPVPKVTWKKDGALLNTSHRIHLFEYGPSPAGKLTIYSLDFDDKGVYSCEATSEQFNITVSAEMRIRVKDKLAALWPFLGIVAEVIVLCVIILIYEKKRSKRLSEEEDSTDANVDNTVDNKDVRHRRT